MSENTHEFVSVWPNLYCGKLAFPALRMLACIAVIAVLAWWVGLGELVGEHFSVGLTVADKMK